MRKATLCSTLVVSIGLALLLHSSATAGPDSDALIEFGLLGAWAIDCSKPPSSANPHVVYANRTGVATRVVRTASDGRDETYEMRNLRMMAPDRVKYDLYDGAGKGPTDYIVMAKVGERIRSHERVRADGTILIKDGRFIPSRLVTSNAATPLFQRCSPEVSANGRSRAMQQRDRQVAELPKLV